MASAIKGPYRVIEKVATGGMATVHKVQAASGQLLALKRPLPEARVQPEMMAMFRDEAILSKLIDTPALPTVHDINVKHHPYIAMELVEGVCVSRLRGKRLSIATVAAIGHSLALTLAALHRAKAFGLPLDVVHRDVSPGNVMVDTQGRLRLLDLGVARSRLQTTLTCPGGVKGKYGYLSPEQCLGEPVDSRSDQFALGVLLYELSTGFTPFHRTRQDTPYLIMQRIAESEVPLEPLRAVAPAWLCHAIARLLSKRPDDRFISADEFALQMHTCAPPQQIIEECQRAATNAPNDRTENLRPLAA